MLVACCIEAAFLLLLFISHVICLKRFRKYKKLADKHLEMVLVMHKWIDNIIKGNSSAEYLKQRGCKNVAIYGMSYIGRNLYTDLVNNRIDVKYAIESNVLPAALYSQSLEVISPQENFPDIDAVVITALRDEEQIEQTIKSKVKCKVYTITDIVYNNPNLD